MEIHKIRWKSPSNIALIKYWGKRDRQLPMNPSLSVSLNKSFTETTLIFEKKEYSSSELSVMYYFEDKRNPVFECKVRSWLETVRPYVDFISDYHLTFNSANSFPHSSGIASSASSFSSLALCLCSMEKEIKSCISGFDSFEMKATYLARLGSGSAARSIFGNYVVWGHSEAIAGSSDEFAIPIDFNVHEAFHNMCDSIMIVSSGTKSVSSSKGHALMFANPYAELRYKIAKLNFNRLLLAMKEGNTHDFIQVVENEALNLHAMFLTANPGYYLALPGTLEIIRKVRQFRETTGAFLCFTLDAGPNVHLLYPQSLKPQIQQFITSELTQFCEDGYWIDDEIGQGPVSVKFEN